MISASLSRNERFARLSDRAHLAWYLMLQNGDRQGRLPGDPLELVALCWPTRAMVNPSWGVSEAPEIVDELHRAGAVIAYEISGVRVVQINKWHEHQVLRWKDGHGRRFELPSKFPNGSGAMDDRDEEDRWYEGLQANGEAPAAVPQRCRSGAAGSAGEVQVQDQDKGSVREVRPTPPPRRNDDALSIRDGGEADRIIRCFKRMHQENNARLVARGERPDFMPSVDHWTAELAAKDGKSIHFTEDELVAEMLRLARCLEAGGYPVTFKAVVRKIGDVWNDMGEDSDPVIWPKQEINNGAGPMAKLIAAQLPEMP